MHLAVAGAGILGTSAAYHLARAGHDVTLLEADQVAGRTTGLAAGLLSLGVQDPIQRRLVHATIHAIDALAREQETTSPLHRPGSYILARTAQETTHLDELHRDLTRMGEAVETLTPRDWTQEMKKRGLEASPDGLEQVLSVPGDAWALSTNTTQLILEAGKRHGLRVRQGTQVESLILEDHEVHGVRLADHSTLDADQVVLAMGAWTKPLLEKHGLRLPALAFTTHAAILSLPHEVQAPIVHDHPGHYYFRPESPTHLLVGNGTDTTPSDPTTFHNTPDPDFFRNVAARITKRFPGLREARLQNAWRGILTATPDRAALAGPHPEAQNLHVFTGDNGYGFMRGWSLGALLAHKIDAKTPLPDGVPEAALAQTGPERFWPRPPETFEIHEGFELTEDTTLPDRTP